MTKPIEERIEKAISKRSVAVCRENFKEAARAAYAENKRENCADRNAIELKHVKAIAKKNTSPAKDMPGDNNPHMVTVAELHDDLANRGIDNTLVNKLGLIIKNGHGNAEAIEIHNDSITGKEKFTVKYNLTQYLPQKK